MVILRLARSRQLMSGGWGGRGGLSKNERNFVGGVWASVKKRYMGVGGLLKHPTKA